MYNERGDNGPRMHFQMFRLVWETGSLCDGYSW